MKTENGHRYANATNASMAFVMINKLGRVSRMDVKLDGVANGRKYSAIHVDYATGYPLTIFVSAKTAKEFSENYQKSF